MKELLLHYQRTTDIDDKMLWKKSAERQMCFVRDTICLELLKCQAFKISQHRSKSIILPVYGFTLKNGIKVICRENFYDWKVSIELPHPSEKDLIPEDLVSEGYGKGKDISDCYCEGFKDEWVYKAYDPEDRSQTKFTIEICDNYRFYTLMYFLKHAYEDYEFHYDGPELSEEEICDKINELYSAYGATEVWERESTEKYTRYLMEGYDILWRPYRVLDDYYFKEKHGIKESMFDVPKDPQKFAHYIKEYDEAYNAFLYELNGYNTEF